MLRKVVKTMVVGGAMLAMVGAANAAEININLYGASAQYLFWNDTADDFIRNSLGGTVLGQAQNTAGNQGITSGTLPNGDTINIRYAAKASFDGVYACKGELAASVADPCASNPSFGPRYRQMAQSLSDTTNLACYEVTLGASDVDGNTFGQRTRGQLKGHLGGGFIDRNVPAIDTTGLTSYQPLVVPFAFFASIDAPVSNLTRTQALMIFSGKTFAWSDFGLADGRDIVACLRHAGSGTQAALAAAVMRGDQATLLNANAFYLYNDGSSDMMRCIDQRGGKPSAVAVGYADADQAVGPGTSYINTKRIQYEGAPANKSNIVNGVYSFWSTQWLFECDPSNATTSPVVTQLMDFAADPTNLPAAKAAFWAAKNEMNVSKANDFAMPSF